MSEMTWKHTTAGGAVHFFASRARWRAWLGQAQPLLYYAQGTAMQKNEPHTTAGMTAYAKNRKEHKRKGAEDAITALFREQKPINFHTVARY